MGLQIDGITFYDNLKPDLVRIMDRSGIAIAEFLQISQKVDVLYFPISPYVTTIARQSRTLPGRIYRSKKATSFSSDAMTSVAPANDVFYIS